MCPVLGELLLGSHIRRILDVLPRVVGHQEDLDVRISCSEGVDGISLCLIHRLDRLERRSGNYQLSLFLGCYGRVLGRRGEGRGKCGDYRGYNSKSWHRIFL